MIDMKVVKVCINEWKNASRDKRELSVCRELGCETLVMAKGKVTDKGTEDTVDGFRVFRYTTRPLGKYVPLLFNRVASVFIWAKWLKKLNADIVSGHDYIAVLIAWLSNIFFGGHAKLVYDSHEFEPWRNAKRTRLQTWRVMKIERFLINQCEFTIIPADMGADELVRLYRLKKRPIVVRSTPKYWDIDEKEVTRTRESFEQYFGETISTVLMYHGGIMENRGIEYILEAIKDKTDVGFVLLGDIVRKAYFHSIESIIKEYGIQKRVLYHPAVPHNELYKFVSAADIGMVIIIPKVKSYYYALPNKFFENIQSLTPIIASDLPEMRKLIREYDIGLLVNGEKPDEISNAIDQLTNNSTSYLTFRNNMKTAKEDLCWEKERYRLIEAYEGLIQD